MTIEELVYGRPLHLSAHAVFRCRLSLIVGLVINHRRCRTEIAFHLSEIMPPDTTKSCRTRRLSGDHYSTSVQVRSAQLLTTVVRGSPHQLCTPLPFYSLIKSDNDLYGGRLRPNKPSNMSFVGSSYYSFKELTNMR